MQLSTLQKSGGVSLIVGSILLLIYSTMFTFLMPLDKMYTDYTSIIFNPNWMWLAITAFIGVILMIFGFFGVYTKLYSQSGFIGLTGFILIELAYILQACKVTWEIFLWPVISSRSESLFLLKDFVIKNSQLVATFRGIASVTIFLGIILFCTALIRSKTFHKSGGILIFVGAFMYGLGPLLSVTVAMIGIFLLSLGCSIVGVNLMKKEIA